MSVQHWLLASCGLLAWLQRLLEVQRHMVGKAACFGSKPSLERFQPQTQHPWSFWRPRVCAEMSTKVMKLNHWHDGSCRVNLCIQQPGLQQGRELPFLQGGHLVRSTLRPVHQSHFFSHPPAPASESLLTSVSNRC